jgi:membrane-associated phospholipid phosphatase
MRMFLCYQAARSTILVGAARFNAGVHHSKDIVASMLMAIVVAALAYREGEDIER